MLPFTRDAFLDNFAQYNQLIWPAQIAAYALGGICVLALVLRLPRSAEVILAVTALMWAWTGIFYHAVSFAQINRAAYGFGALFLVQAAILLHGAWRGRLTFQIRPDVASGFGLFLMGYAALIYPAIGHWSNHGYPSMPMFGVTPCPVTLYTLGLLLQANCVAAWRCFAIPVVWALIGGSAAILLAVPQDWLLLASGLLVPVVAFMRGTSYFGDGVSN